MHVKSNSGITRGDSGPALVEVQSNHGVASKALQRHSADMSTRDMATTVDAYVLLDHRNITIFSIVDQGHIALDRGLLKKDVAATDNSAHLGLPRFSNTRDGSRKRDRLALGVFQSEGYRTMRFGCESKHASSTPFGLAFMAPSCSLVA